MQVCADRDVAQLGRRAVVADGTVGQERESEGQIPVAPPLRVRAVGTENPGAVDVIERDEFACDVVRRTFRRKLAGLELKPWQFLIAAVRAERLWCGERDCAQ